MKRILLGKLENDKCHISHFSSAENRWKRIRSNMQSDSTSIGKWVNIFSFNFKHVT